MNKAPSLIKKNKFWNKHFVFFIPGIVIAILFIPFGKKTDKLTYANYLIANKRAIKILKREVPIIFDNNVDRKDDSLRNYESIEFGTDEEGVPNGTKLNLDTLADKKLASDSGNVLSPYKMNVYLGIKEFNGDTINTGNMNYDGIFHFFYSDTQFVNCVVTGPNFDNFAINPSNNFEIDSAEFHGALLCRLTKMETNIVLTSIYFNRYVRFYDADSLSHSLVFSNCYFNNVLSFNYTDSTEVLKETSDWDGLITQKVSGKLILRNCRFNGKLDLAGITFLPNSQLKIYNCTLPLILDLRGVTASKIDLNGFLKTPDRPCYLLLDNSEIDNLDFEYDNYELIIPDYLGRNKINSLYQKVLKYFKMNGYDDSYEKLDIEYRRCLVSLDDWSEKSGFFTFLTKHISPAFSKNLLYVCNSFRPQSV